MHLGQYLRISQNSMAPAERVRLWRAAVRCLAQELPPDHYHSRLSPASFEVEKTADGPRLFLGDPHYLRPLGSGDVAQPSWPFAAPEQTGLVEGKPEVRSNVYSLGLFGPHLFTGKEPTERFPWASLPEAIVLEPTQLPDLLPLSRVQQNLFARILGKATAKRPSERYSTLEEFEAELALLEADVGGATDSPSEFLIGREREQEQIESFLARVRLGGSGVFHLEGDPGQGKSFLWHAVAAEERRSEEAWCFFKCPQTGTIPFAAVRSLLSQFFSFLQNREEYATALAHITGRARQILQTILPEAEALFFNEAEETREWQDARTDAIPLTQETGYELIRVLRTLLNGRVATLFVVDDLQWADDQSLAFLVGLARERLPATGVVLIGRPEGALRLGEALDREEVVLEGLSDTDGERLFHWLRSSDQGESAGEEYGRVNRYAQGNPLAIIQLARGGLEGKILSSSDRGGSGVAATQLLASLARSRFETLRDDGRRLLRFLSLLLPPAPMEYLRSASTAWTVPVEALLDECERALLLTVNEEMVGFSHDSIESLARNEAVHEPALISEAALVLYAASQSGDERALFALAQLITLDPGRSSPLLSLTPEQAVGVLRAASKRALATLAAQQALTFAEAALFLMDTSKGDDILELHLIAHEAAFRLDDVLGMSRHFAHIYASRDSIVINRARTFWIRRNYANSLFYGALRIGWNALKELGAIEGNPASPELVREAAEYLRSLDVGKIEEALLAKETTGDPVIALQTSIASLLLLPTDTVDRDRLALLAAIEIRQALLHGRTPETGMAFIAWELWETGFAIDPARVRKLFSAACRLANSTGDRVASHSVRTYARIFSLLWSDSYDKGMKDLLQLYDEGIELGNFQFASHATHLYVQALLYHGAPLNEVFQAMQKGRAEMAGYNHHRTAHAVAKYAQAVETLLGRTSDPFGLSGSIMDEESFFEKIEAVEDHLSITGFLALKGFLAMYGGRADLALDYYRQLKPHAPHIASLHDNGVTRFLSGMAEFSHGSVAEGRRALADLKRWSKAIPVNHRHRQLALKAENARAKGRRRRALRLYEGARIAALEAEYPHEAALIAERHASASGTTASESRRATELLHLAESLYSKWGAAHAAQRLRAALNWGGSTVSVVPTILEETFVRSLLGARSEDGLLISTVEHLLRFSGAHQAILRLTRRRDSKLYVAKAGGAVVGPRDPKRRDFKDPVVTRFTTGTLTCASGETSSVEIEGQLRTVYGEQVSPTESSSLDFLLVTAPGAGSFSTAVKTRSSAGLTLASVLLSLRWLSAEHQEQGIILASAKETAARAEEYGRILFGSLSQALLLQSESGEVLFHNPAATSYLRFGQKPEPVLEPELEQIAKQTRRSMDRESSEVVEASWQGRELRISVVAASSPEESRRRIFALTLEDITEQRGREEMLRRREKQLILADRMSSLGMLSATIAHEVSNPNHVIQLNAHALLLLLQRGESGEFSTDSAAIAEAERLVKQVVEGASRIEQVVSGVKAYGKDGRQDVTEILEVDELCRRALRFSRIMAAAYTADLRYEPGEEIPPVRGVRGQLEQAIINLIKNGCEALLDRSGRVRLSSCFDDQAGEVVISVGDEGEGIDPALRSRIGDPFTSSRADSGGTGLGLSIVQAIAERHGGSFRLVDGEEYTTEAELRLPPA